jgi:hypothetical protein
MVQIFNLLILYRRPALPPTLLLRPFRELGVCTFGNFVRSRLPQRYIPTRRPNRGGLGL